MVELYDDKVTCDHCGHKFEEEQISEDYYDINLCFDCAQKEGER